MNYLAATGPSKGLTVEVWPCAVDPDETAIWLLDRDAWRTGPVPASVGEWDAVLHILQGHAARPAVVHQTSCRDEGATAVHTYLAVVELDDMGLTVWPHAQPFTPELLAAMDGPIIVPATVAPVPTHFDVFTHGVRHLAALAHGVGLRRLCLDLKIRESLPVGWLSKLEPLEPELATMYAPRRVTAA